MSGKILFFSLQGIFDALSLTSQKLEWLFFEFINVQIIDKQTINSPVAQLVRALH
jgi:hypothetical protein